MEAQPFIVVGDVEASSRWYQKLLGCESGHGGTEYERIVHGDKIILQLHDWDVHDHKYLGDPAVPTGNGVLLWFLIDDIEAARHRAGSLGAVILEDTHFNPNASHYELWLQDPDGYRVVLASPPVPRG